MHLFFARVWAYLKATAIRFKSQSPTYWKTLQTFFTWLAATTAMASEQGQDIIAQLTGYGLNVPDVVKVIAGHIATAAFVARIIAQLPVKMSAVGKKEYADLNDPSRTLPVKPATEP